MIDLAALEVFSGFVPEQCPPEIKVNIIDDMKIIRQVREGADPRFLPVHSDEIRFVYLEELIGDVGIIAFPLYRGLFIPDMIRFPVPGRISVQMISRQTGCGCGAPSGILRSRNAPCDRTG